MILTLWVCDDHRCARGTTEIQPSSVACVLHSHVATPVVRVQACTGCPSLAVFGLLHLAKGGNHPQFCTLSYLGKSIISTDSFHLFKECWIRHGLTEPVICLAREVGAGKRHVNFLYMQKYFTCVNVSGIILYPSRSDCSTNGIRQKQPCWLRSLLLRVWKVTVSNNMV